MQNTQPYGPLPGFPSANWLIRGQLIHAGYPGASDEVVAASIRHAVLDSGTTALVCLQPDAELQPLPSYMAGEMPASMAWLHFPIVDGGTAPDDELRGLVQQCLALLAKGGVLLVHCLGGHGRSGILCACLAGALLGLSPSDALALVKAAHDTREDPWASRHRSPETSAQVEQVGRLLRQSGSGGCGYCRSQSRIGGGLNNALYRVAVDVALKLYGPGTASLTDRPREQRMMRWLEQRAPDGCLGKRLLAPLPGGHGHFEEWVEGEPVPFAEMIRPHGPAIGALLGRLHAVPPPPEEEDARAGGGGSGADARFFTDMASWASALPEAWTAQPAVPGRAVLAAEVDWLRNGGGRVVGPSPSAILHRDVHGANILRLAAGGSLKLIDFEFADVGPRAFDVANFFLECAFVEEDESWDWGRVPSEADQADFARAYATAAGAAPEAAEAEAQALLVEWAAGWGLVAHVWNVLWALTTAAAAGPVGADDAEQGFDYVEYACLRWERYLHEKRLAVPQA